MTGTKTFVTSCKNSVTPDLSELTFAITGTAPTEVVAGSPVTLSDQSWTVGVPASVLNTGLGLGLLNIGDVVAGSVTPALFATNTVEGTRKLAPITISVGPIQDDGSASVPPKALPAAVTFAVPDTTWTTVGGTVGYGLDTTAMEVAIGPLKVSFTCTPTDTTLAVVQTNVVGSTGVAPGSRQPTTVLGAQVAPAELPRTGFGLLAPLAFAVGLLDLGFLVQTAVGPQRRRRPDRSS